MATKLSDKDAYALRCKLAGVAIPDDLEITAPTRWMIDQVKTAENGLKLTSWLTEQGLIEQVMRFDPKAPFPEPEQDEDDVYIPPLPDYAQLSDEAIAQIDLVGDWWRRTVDWCAQRSPMTPRHFLESGVIWIISLAVARRVFVEVHAKIYPHLFVLWIAETSRYAKTTGMKTIHDIINIVMPYMLIPGSTSPEGLKEILSGSLPTNYEQLPQKDQQLVTKGRAFAGQRGILKDEYSELLAAAKKDYMAGFVELMMEMYDAPDRVPTYTKSGGILYIKRAALSVFGATTPAALTRTISNELWENGTLARYLLMFREQPLEYDDSYIRVVPPTNIINTLLKLRDRLPEAKHEISEDDDEITEIRAKLTPEAETQYRAYAKAVRSDMLDDLDIRMMGNYTRLHIQALKIALALAVIDWVESTDGYGPPEILLGHFALAQQIVERGRESLHQMMPVLNETKDTRNQQSIVGILKSTVFGLTKRDLGRRLGISSKDLTSSLDVLIESGDVVEVEHKPTTGRPTIIYRHIKHTDLSDTK